MYEEIKLFPCKIIQLLQEINKLRCMLLLLVYFFCDFVLHPKTFDKLFIESLTTNSQRAQSYPFTVESAF